MALSIAITASVMAMRAAPTNGNGIASTGFTRHFNLGQALPVCNQAIDTRFGKQIQSKTYDDLSNRYDDQRGVHLLFADIVLQKDSKLLSYYVVCTISANTNEVRNFEIVRVSKETKFRL